MKTTPQAASPIPWAQKTLAYITAGAGGMYCGSCMHDNTLARALSKRGVDLVLVPTYTPIRTDEENVSLDRVFFGGINVFLQQTVPWFRYLPRRLRSLLDHPTLVRWATARPAAINARLLGSLTVSMLQGVRGRQRAEAHRLADWLKESLRPQLVLFTNMLIAGCADHLKRTWHAPLLVTLQGDDVFLESLPEPYRSRALQEIRRLVPAIDGFLVHSRYYADFMQDYLGIPPGKLHVVPLGIDTTGFPSPGETRHEDTTSAEGPAASRRVRTIGYLARLAPEKGLHLLVEAFLRLRQREPTRDVRLRIAGWLSKDQRNYAEAQFEKLSRATSPDAWQYDGVVDRSGKLDLLRNVDVFSVPTTYRDPKGLFVLEAMAAGVPVVQPAHGAFPELLGRFSGGVLVPPNDPAGLADALEYLLADDARRRELGWQGARSVHALGHADAMARATWEVCEAYLASRPP